MEEIILDSEDFCVADKEALTYVIDAIKKEGQNIKAILDSMPDDKQRKLKLLLWDGIKKRRYAAWGLEVDNILDFVLTKTAEKAIIFYEEYLAKKELDKQK